MRVCLLCGVLLAGGGLWAQRDGTLHWPARVGANAYVTYSSPAVSADGKTIFVGVETRFQTGLLVALTSEGGPAWPRPFSTLDPIESSPALSRDGSVVYFGCNDGKVYALDARTGAKNWEASLGDVVSSSPMVAEDGTIYVGCNDDWLYALTDRGRSVEVRRLVKTNGPIFSTPAVGRDGTIYVSSLDGSLYAVTPQGQLKWPPFVTGGALHGSPAIGTDGTIYIGSNNHRVYAISPEDGTKRWDFFTNGKVDASPVIGADGTVYVGSGDTYFYAFNPTGPDEQRVRWRVEIKITNPTTAAVRADGAIIFGGDDNILRALDPDGGRELWRFAGVQGDADAIFGAPTVASDGSIYFGSLDGFLYRLHGSGSPLSTLSSWPAFGRDSTHSGRVDRIAREGKLDNLSARVWVGERESSVGFYAAGSGVHLLRAVGPGLAGYGVSGFMADPRLQLFSFPGETPVPVPDGVNDDWEPNSPGGFSARDAADALGAFPLREGSKDAAVVPLLSGGRFTAQVGSSDGSPGVVLVEAYSNIGDAPARLLNLSTRNHTDAGEKVLIAGFAVGGTEPTRLLLRGVGPGLAQFGVSGFLAQPRLELFRANENRDRLRENDGWTKGGLGYDLMAAARSVGAFLPLQPADCAMIAVVAPGLYTIQVSGANGTSGEALAEIYVLP